MNAILLFALDATLNEPWVYPRFVSTQTQDVGQKSAWFATANDLYFICLKADGNWVICCCITLLFSFPQPRFLFSYHRIMVERMQWHQKTRRATPRTAHHAGRGYFRLFFVEAMPLSQHSTYRTSSHFQKWMQILIFFIYLLYLSSMRRNYHTWTGKKK